MNTIEQSPVDLTPDQSMANETPESVIEPRIRGFDGGTRPFLKEPSLYLSIAVVFIATAVCLGKTPTVFWLSFIALTAVAIMFHVLAERLLFRAKKEYDAFTAPLEGVFVVTFGSILPGIGLLAYGVYSLSTAQQSNVFEELGKLALLLVVPIFNFIVWSTVRKGYLIRPRFIGLMNGLAIGLSASWTAIWLKSVFFAHGDPSCKFGWMLLLFTSPLLLFAATCLSFDLWRKTEASIGRITTTFSVLGGLLSCLFVFAPMARAFIVQSLLIDARQDSVVAQAQAISVLRTLATVEDLQPSRYPVSGFALAELLIPDRGLDTGTDLDRDLYFKITGKPYLIVDRDNKSNNALDPEEASIRSMIGPEIPLLSLAKSQISGNLDAATLSSSIDWTLTFQNLSWAPKEACGEIAIPRGAVVSRVTLWIDGEPREGAFAPAARAQDAYQSVVSRQRDPLLVTMPASDRVLVQCFPVPARGEMKIRLGFKLPLETTDGKTCSVQLPALLGSNFAQVKRHRINLFSKDMPVLNVAAMETKRRADGYRLNGIIKSNDRSRTIGSVVVQRTEPLMEFATPDWYSKNQRYIVEKLQEVTTPALKHLLVVVDSSESLKNDVSQIKQALSIIPPHLKPIVYFAAEPDAEKAEDTQILGKPLEQAQSAIKPDAFVGGKDNLPALREALETAAEESNNAVLWIHGPQPLSQNLSGAALDLVHGVRLYDLQIESGPDAILQALQQKDFDRLLTCESIPGTSSVNDFKALVSGWETGGMTLSLRRTVSTNRPQTTIVTDRLASAQVTALWANEEVARLLANGKQQQAEKLAAHYRLVSAVTGAVVLENASDYKFNKLDPGAYKDQSSNPDAGTDQNQSGNPDSEANKEPLKLDSRAYKDIATNGGLVGAPVDPRYGQSNEVGQMADYGYDTARDIVRLLTVLSLMISGGVAFCLLRSGNPKTGSKIMKAVALVLVVPTIVHLMGTFMINNFGGLGGGL